MPDWRPLEAALAATQGVASSAQFRAHGVGAEAVRWAVHKAVLHRITPGVFCGAGEWARAGRTERHRMHVIALQRRAPVHIATGTSAAALLGLPLPFGPPRQPRMTVPRDDTARGATGRRYGAANRRSWLALEEVIVLEGARLTSPVRTVIDCCRELDDGWALALADAAASRGWLTRESLQAHLDYTPSAPGRRRATWLAQHLDRRPESPLESLSRAVLITAELPVPQPQQWISTPVGYFRVDLADLGRWVITEADGKLKYVVDPGRPEQQPLYLEKVREDALRDAGFEVVRFTMSDYGSRELWLTKYRRALARAFHRHAQPGSLPRRTG